MSESPDNEPSDEADVDVDNSPDEEAADGAASADQKSTLIAILASWFWPGLGHFYVGSTTKGLVFAILALISYALIFLVIGWFTTPILVLIAAYDAYRETEAYNADE